MPTGRTLYEKIFDAHVVAQRSDGMNLVYIDRHLLHEVTSPQAFEALRMRGRAVRCPDLAIAVPDHNIATTFPRGATNGASQRQLALLESNAASAGIRHFGADAPEQGIVHVIGPELGFTLPGLTLACGDSHTSTHGALGALGLGIGTSDIEQILATQTLWLRRSRSMLVEINGSPGRGVGAKDLALALVARLGAAGAVGYVIEYAGEAVTELSIEGRMTLCNMAVEAGARSALIAPDDKAIAWIKGRAMAPSDGLWVQASAAWRALASDKDAVFERHVQVDAASVAPLVTWGTSPQDAVSIEGRVPDPASVADPARRAEMENALAYMGLRPGQALQGIAVENIFIGSCTNSRIEDLRSAAEVVEGRRVAASVRQAIVVPGSGATKRQAEAEGLDRIFLDAGFEWREAGCSMCLGMNPDKVAPGERCASTSNRNFVGRQGPGARTHLMSPAMAAAAAVAGHLQDVRTL
jgi:3-isopropylmalate/(R)-2-methylmalate dehydratase large subunit